jgi:death-on-curing protein
MHALAAAHAFLDGNKRTAWTASMTFLEVNGLVVPMFGQEEMALYMEAVALHVHEEMSTAEFLASLVI